MRARAKKRIKVREKEGKRRVASAELPPFVSCPVRGSQYASWLRHVLLVFFGKFRVGADTTIFAV